MSPDSISFDRERWRVAPLAESDAPLVASTNKHRESAPIDDVDTVEVYRPNVFVEMNRTEQSTGPARADLEPRIELLESAGLAHAEAEELLVRGATRERAVELMQKIASMPLSLASFGARTVALSTLQRMAGADHAVSGTEVRRIIAKHDSLCIVRPDGYLVRASTGRPIQRAGDPKLVNGVLCAGDLQVGRFYASEQGVLRRVDTDLAPKEIVGEVALDHDLFNKMLDGVEDAAIGMAKGIGRLIEDPVRSMEDLAKLPDTVASLLRQSPELWEQFKNMTRGDQVRLVSNIITTVLTLMAGAGAIRAGVASAGIGTIGIGGIYGGRTIALTYNLSLASAAVGVMSIGPGSLTLLSGAKAQLSEADESVKGTTEAKATSAQAKYPSAKELGRRLGCSEDEFHRVVKPSILKDFRQELKMLGTNPDIGVDAVGNVVLRSAETGEELATGVPFEAYAP